MVLKGKRLPRGDFRQPNTHGCVRVQGPARFGWPRKFLSKSGAHTQLFVELTGKGRLRLLARFDFATWKLPQSGQGRGRTAPCDKQPGWIPEAVHHRCTYHLYQSIHRPILWGRMEAPASYIGWPGEYPGPADR